MMSVHDALEAWLAGDLTADEACRLTGATDEDGLRELLPACGIDVDARNIPVNPFVRENGTDILAWGSCDDATGRPPDRKE